MDRERRVLELARRIVYPGKRTGSRTMYCCFFLSLVIHTLFLLYAGQPTSQQCLERRIKVELVPMKPPPVKIPASIMAAVIASVPVRASASIKIPAPKASVHRMAHLSPSPGPLKDTSHSKDTFHSNGIPHSVPQPVSQVPQTQEVRIPTEHQNPEPVFPYPKIVPLAKPSKPLTEQKATAEADDRSDDRSQERTAGEISTPPADSPGPSDGASDAGMAGQVAGAAGAGAAGKAKRVSLSYNLPSSANIKAASGHVDPALAAYQGYQEAIRRRIERHKRFPLLATERGWEGIVKVRFLLRRDGRVEQVSVTRSSAFALLDKAAMRAVEGGAPFPPFPESIRKSSLWFEVPLVFELREGAG